MNKLIGAFGLLIIVVSHSAAGWTTTERSQYFVCLTLLALGFIITLSSGLLSDFAQWLSLREGVANGIMRTPDKGISYRNGIVVTCASIIFLLAAWIIIDSAENKSFPPLLPFYLIVSIALVLSIARNVKVPDIQGLEGTGFFDAIDRELFVKVKERQYVYVKPVSGMVSWKLIRPNEYVVLTNKYYFVFDLNKFKIEKDIPKLFAQSDDSYINAWIQLNINELELRKIKQLDFETLTVINDFSNKDFVSDFLGSEKAEFESSIRNARDFYQMTRAQQINSPQNYFANRMNIYQSIQNFTAIAERFKEKVNSYISGNMQTIYLVSREINLQIFTMDIVLSYVFDNRPFNGSIITEIDNMHTQLIEEDREIDRTTRQTLLTGLMDAIKVLGRPEMIEKVLKKWEQADDNRYIHDPIDVHVDMSVRHSSQPENHVRPIIQLPIEKEFDLTDARNDLIDFMNSPELHTENVHLNLEGFVKADFFKNNPIDYRKLTDKLLSNMQMLRTNGEINLAGLNTLLKGAIIKSSE